MLILGLGNPGNRYVQNRHNVGFWVIDQVSRFLSVPVKKRCFLPYAIGSSVIGGKKIFLVKPYTYMNRSGDILKRLFKSTGRTLKDIIVVCDNMDLPPGQVRLKLKGSSGGQRGLDSIILNLGSDVFTRIFIGIGRPSGNLSVPEYVLTNPPPQELELIEKACLRAAEAVISLASEDPVKVMNDLNRRE